jgi:hypothetical protein
VVGSRTPRPSPKARKQLIYPTFGTKAREISLIFTNPALVRRPPVIDLRYGRIAVRRAARVRCKGGPITGVLSVAAGAVSTLGLDLKAGFLYDPACRRRLFRGGGDIFCEIPLAGLSSDATIVSAKTDQRIS